MINPLMALPRNLTGFPSGMRNCESFKTNALPAAGWEKLRRFSGRCASGGDWLLFTDADGVHLPGSTARALADAAATGAGLVSYSPEQEMHTWWERALIPFRLYASGAEIFPTTL